mgnify:CR=1 FL=1|jgi:hypothetical protein
MNKIKNIIRSIESIDIVLITAFCLYLAFLISNVAKMF